MDKVDESKKAARKLMIIQAEQEKQSFIRQVKNGLGEQITKELEQLKPPSRRKVLWNKIKMVLGL